MQHIAILPLLNYREHDNLKKKRIGQSELLRKKKKPTKNSKIPLSNFLNRRICRSCQFRCRLPGTSRMSGRKSPGEEEMYSVPSKVLGKISLRCYFCHTKVACGCQVVVACTLVSAPVTSQKSLAGQSNAPASLRRSSLACFC